MAGRIKGPCLWAAGIPFPEPGALQQALGAGKGIPSSQHCSGSFREGQEHVPRARSSFHHCRVHSLKKPPWESPWAPWACRGKIQTPAERPWGKAWSSQAQPPGADSPETGAHQALLGSFLSHRGTAQVLPGPSVGSGYLCSADPFSPAMMQPHQPTQAATNDLPSLSGTALHREKPSSSPAPPAPAPGAVLLAAGIPLHALGCHGHGAGSFHPQMSLKSQTRAKLGA